MNEITEYINLQPQEIQKILNTIRTIILENIPNCEERFSWNMPTFYWKENVVHFAVGKNHIGLYPSPTPIKHFENELKNYKTSKGAIQFPLNQEIPYDLIKQIVLFRVEEIKNKYNL